MTGKQAADALDNYWNHMPTEAVHVSGVPVRSTASRSTHSSEDSEGSQRGSRRASRGRGDDEKRASGDREESEEGRDSNTSQGDGGGDGRSRQSGGSGSRSSTRRGKSAHVADQSNGLPAGWQKGYDSLHRLYYYNSYLGESSWTPPPGSHLHDVNRRGDAERRRHVSRRRVGGGDHDHERRIRHSSESHGRKEGDAGGVAYVDRASAPPKSHTRVYFPLSLLSRLCAVLVCLSGCGLHLGGIRGREGQRQSNPQRRRPTERVGVQIECWIPAFLQPN